MNRRVLFLIAAVVMLRADFVNGAYVREIGPEGINWADIVNEFLLVDFNDSDTANLGGLERELRASASLGGSGDKPLYSASSGALSTKDSTPLSEGQKTDTNAGTGPETSKMPICPISGWGGNLLKLGYEKGFDGKYIIWLDSSATLSQSRTFGPGVLFFAHSGAVVYGSGSSTLTVYSPEHLRIGKRQKFVGDGVTLRFTVGGEVSPAWWGIGSDDGVDDSGAIQAAIDAIVTTNGGICRLPVGVYRLEKGLRIETNPSAEGIILRGEGKAGGVSVLEPDTGGSAITIAGHGIEVSDLSIDCNGIEPNGIKVEWGSQLRIHDIWIGEAANRAFDCEIKGGVYWSTFERLHSFACPYGFYIDGTKDGFNNNALRSCMFSGAMFGVVNLYVGPRVEGLEISSVDCSYGDGTGLYIAPTAQVVARNLYIEGTGKPSIDNDSAYSEFHGGLAGGSDFADASPRFCTLNQGPYMPYIIDAMLPNLVPNGDVESWDSLSPKSWGAFHAAMSKEEETVKSGKSSLKIRSEADWSYAYVSADVRSRIKDARKYGISLRMWVRGSSTNDKTNRIGFKTSGSTELLYDVPKDDNWHEVFLYAPPADSTEYAQVTIHVNQTGIRDSDDVLYADLVHVTVGRFVGNYSEYTPIVKNGQADIPDDIF